MNNSKSFSLLSFISRTFCYNYWQSKNLDIENIKNKLSERSERV